MYLREKDRIISEDFITQQSWFPCRLSGWPEAASEHQSQKVKVRYLSGQPIEREPSRAAVRYLSGRSNGREPSRAHICKDI
jgi:hypothetical protein